MARTAAAAEAPPEPWQRAMARVTFFHAVRRRRDRDNALASLKSAFDGIVDGGVLADDAGLTFGPVMLEIDREFPRVEIEVQGE